MSSLGRHRAILAVLAIASVLFSAGSADARARFEEHVVVLKVTYQSWDEDRPWAKTNPATRTASAVVVEGPLLLTRAQLVANATLIQVERLGDGRTWPARIAHVDPEIDLALIALDDPAFFDGLTPATLAKFAPTDGDLSTVRWNDRQLEVSAGRVSTVEVHANRYGNVAHAFIEATTDLENGGWSEPVFDGRKLAGLTASQKNQRASIIPSEILRSYISRARPAITGAPYQGFARIDLLWQNNQDPSLARYLGLEGEARGVLIRGTRRGGSACGVLHPRDILLSLDGYDLDTIGNVRHARYGQTRFTQIAVENHSPGDIVNATVFRDGRELQVALELKAYPSEMRLIPWRRDNRPPAYFIGGGLVFRELDGPFLRTWGKEWTQQAPTDLVVHYQLNTHSQTPDMRRMVLLSGVLPDWYNLGYHDLANLVVSHVNGQPIDSIPDLVAAFGAPEPGPPGEAGFHVIKLAPNGMLAEIVLDAELYESASKRILEAYDIPQAMRLGEQTPELALGPPCEDLEEASR